MASSYSVLEQRNILLEQSTSLLVKSLTGFTGREENFRTCLSFSFNKFRNHTFLTTNSHEVKRNVDGVCEKLRFSNLHDVEKTFRSLVQETVTHELAVGHYEKDAAYSIIDLLITLAHDPITNLKQKLRSGESVIVKRVVSSKKPLKDNRTFISSLLKDNFKLQKNETDSELSEWTDSDEGALSDESNSDDTAEEISPSNTSLTSALKPLRPPTRPNSSTMVRLENSVKWLEDNVQHQWWASEMNSITSMSTHPTANFCVLWQKHLSDKSLGFLKPRSFSFVTEYCLLREIFWMFHNPVDCKFFAIHQNEIVIRPNVTMPSTMPESLQIFLADLVRSMNLMRCLTEDCKESYQSSTLSHTLETYFKIVQSILDGIKEFMLIEEATVKDQMTSYTILNLTVKMRNHSKMLEMLWSIHSTSVLDETKYPPHICSSYLLANLHNHVLQSCCKEKKNLAIMFLVTCLKSYLEMFEIWCTEARLDDLKKEFLMEGHEESDFVVIRPRLFMKSKEKSFYLNDTISRTIIEDSIIGMMLRYCNKACFTLNIVSRLDRVHEMRKFVNDSVSIYNEFSSRLGKEVENFAQANQPDLVGDQTKPPETTPTNAKLIDDIRSGMIANEDDLLLLAFQSTFHQLTDQSLDQVQEISSSIEFLEKLAKASDFVLLPLEHTVHRILADLLHKKISTAEQFVMNIYTNEFHVEQNLQEIRKVFFLDSNELVNFFYHTLFPQMESCEFWANPYHLTIAFNDAISHHHSSTLYSVEVNRVDNRFVLGSIDGITIFFNLSNKTLMNVFSPEIMKKYNEVFRLLLKVKWGQRILSCLKFPNFFRHRKPYAKLQLIDLVIKRLSLTRFAMQHSINTLHNRLHVMLQVLSLQFDSKVTKAKNMSEVIALHTSFVEAFHNQCFLGDESSQIHGIIIETLKTTKVLQDEWSNVSALASLDNGGYLDSETLTDLNRNSIKIEKAFGSCEYQLKLLLDF